MDSSIYSSIGRKSNDTHDQNSISKEIQAFNSSFLTHKDLKTIKNFRSSLRKKHHHLYRNQSLSLGVFPLNTMKQNLNENAKNKINFHKTKSTDSLLPGITEAINVKLQPSKTFKKFMNLKIVTNNDNINNFIYNRNKFFTLNKSNNFSTSFNSLHSINLQNKNESNKTRRKLKNSFSFNNIYNMKNTNINDNNNFIKFHHTNFVDGLNYYKTKLKKEYLYDYINKIKKTVVSKYTLEDKKKLVQLEKEKIETNLEQYDLNINLLKKLNILFKKYYLSLDKYLLFLKVEIKNGLKENAELKENKKELSNEIFILGHRVYKIKNKLRDYLNNKYFLLSVKNHTKNFDYFSSKDKKEFNKDLYILEKLDQQLNSIFEEKTEEQKDKTENDKINNENKEEEIAKEKEKKFSDIRKTFFSQKTLGAANKLKEIFSTPEQFMKDLDLISKGINKSLKTYNKQQIVLLEDKKLLNILIEKSHNNENMENEFQTLKNKLNDKLNYYNYLKNNKKNLLPNCKKNLKIDDTLQIQIKSILNNIKKSGDKKLIKYLCRISNDEILLKYDLLCKNKLYMLELIEEAILFLKKNNNSYKERDNNNYLEIESKIRYLSHVDRHRKEREKDKLKRKIILLKILEKNNNLLYIPNKKNFIILNNKFENKYKSRSNTKNEVKKAKTFLDIDLIY